MSSILTCFNCGERFSTGAVNYHTAKSCPHPAATCTICQGRHCRAAHKAAKDYEARKALRGGGKGQFVALSDALAALTKIHLIYLCL